MHPIIEESSRTSWALQDFGTGGFGCAAVDSSVGMTIFVPPAWLNLRAVCLVRAILVAPRLQRMMLFELPAQSCFDGEINYSMVCRG